MKSSSPEGHTGFVQRSNVPAVNDTPYSKRHNQASFCQEMVIELVRSGLSRGEIADAVHTTKTLITKVSVGINKVRREAIFGRLMILYCARVLCGVRLREAKSGSAGHNGSCDVKRITGA